MQSPSSLSQLSPKQREVLEALLAGSTITNAATAAGIHRSTVHLWCRENTVFRAALNDAQSQQAGLVLDGLRAAAGRAVETLEQIMADSAAPASVRLRAATTIIHAVAESDPYTRPAGPRLTASDVDRIIEAAADAGEAEAELRRTISVPPPGDPSTDATAPTARNAPCPCGSGDKFKRCCGRHAPGVFTQARAA